MSNPSLTPNEDLVRRLLAEAPDLHSVAEPGLSGVYARFLIAMREARSLAVAREMDRTTPQEDIVVAFAQATAAEIFIVAEGLAGPGLHQALAAQIVREVARVAEDFAARRLASTKMRPVQVATS